MNPASWPTTLDDAVNEILDWLTNEDKEKIRMITKSDFALAMHFELGMKIRNQFGLSSEANKALLDSYAAHTGRVFIHTDDVSDAILEKVWEQICMDR